MLAYEIDRYPGGNAIYGRTLEIKVWIKYFVFPVFAIKFNLTWDFLATIWWVFQNIGDGVYREALHPAGSKEYDLTAIFPIRSWWETVVMGLEVSDHCWWFRYFISENLLGDSSGI